MSDIVSDLLDRAYCHKPNDFLCERAAMEIERLRLTDEEREAIEWCLSLPMLDRDAVRMMPLRSLLERTKCLT
jgi:hypothetical protein